MEFLGFIETIKERLESTLPTYLNALKTKYPAVKIVNPNRYVINEYPDTDRYGDKVVIYIIPTDYDYEELSNESEALENPIDIYVTFSKETEAVLSAQSLVYAEAIYNLIKNDRSLGGSVDYAMISKIKPYSGIEGTTSAKALYVGLKIVKEV